MGKKLWAIHFFKAIERESRRMGRKKIYRYFRFYKKNNNDQLLLIYIHTDKNFQIDIFVSHKLLTSNFFEEVKETDT